MKKILLPTDFSDNAWNALKFAALIFKETQCEFKLLNTYHPAPEDISIASTDYVTPTVRQSKESLKAELKKFASLSHHPLSTASTKSVYGEMSHVIDEICKKHKIDFIVMGTKGAGGLKEILIGSNTVQVMNTVKVPLICVPENAALIKPFKVVFASDYDDVDNDVDLLPMREISIMSGKPLQILIVRNKRTMPSGIIDAKEELELDDFLENIDHEIIIKDNENVSSEIINFANENNVGLVVMLKRKHDFWEKLFNQSMTRKVAFHTNTPLLILHESDD